MDHTKFRKALHGMLSQRPELQQKFATALREEAQLGKTANRHYLLWQALEKIQDIAPKVLELIHSHPEELEAWHEHNLCLANEYLESVMDALQCKVKHEVPPYQVEEIAGDNLEIKDFE